MRTLVLEGQLGVRPGVFWRLQRPRGMVLFLPAMLVTPAVVRGNIAEKSLDEVVIEAALSPSRTRGGTAPTQRLGRARRKQQAFRLRTVLWLMLEDSLFGTSRCRWLPSLVL